MGEINQVPEILTAVNKEKFRRKLLLITRFLALLLILAIVWIGFIQIIYVKEVNQIRATYGNLGYCYMCGKEALRICSCQYLPDLLINLNQANLTAIAEQTALQNVMPCIDKNFRNDSLNQIYAQLPIDNKSIVIKN